MWLPADVAAGDLAQLDAADVPQCPAQLVLGAVAADDQAAGARRLLDEVELVRLQPGVAEDVHAAVGLVGDEDVESVELAAGVFMLCSALQRLFQVARMWTIR